MGRHWGGLFTALIAFLIFHDGEGAPVGVDMADGQMIVRAVPKGSGIKGNTLIETGAGTVPVIESPEEVMDKIDKARKQK